MSANVFFYRYDFRKKECSKQCKTCIGPLDNDCIICGSNLIKLPNGLCGNECPEHFYEYNQICYGIFTLYYIFEKNAIHSV